MALPTPWLQTPSLQNYEKKISVVLSHPVCGILLRQPLCWHFLCNACRNCNDLFGLLLLPVFNIRGRTPGGAGVMHIWLCVVSLGSRIESVRLNAQ